MSTYVVEVNEGVVDASQQCIDWWTMFTSIYGDGGRLRYVKEPCVVGGLVEVACDDIDHAEWLAQHMVKHGGLPKSAVRAKRGRS